MDKAVSSGKSTALNTHGYWAFIDGLRAIAVLSVVLYHAGLRWLPGGYVGVDIFFVISGYLIIGQIVTQRRRGTFSFSEFWSRRALRILPPYLLVILVCSLIAPFILVMPGEFEAFANEVAYSALMVVNHLFLDQQGYFDRGADTKVLLHLWSLAVEEQFYIVSPLLITALYWMKSTYYRFLVLALFVASLWACVQWTGIEGDKNYAFFLMPLRAWEFIAGGAVALAVPFVAGQHRAFRETLALAGAAAIIYAVATFTHHTPFPSFWAAIPVFGASAIILAGMSGPCAVRQLLQTRPMIAIGLISYSWYLWHWPALVFARIYNFGDHIPSVDAAMVALSAALATATYFLVERPIRRARERRSRSLGWAPALVGVVTCITVCFVGYGLFTRHAAGVSIALSANLLPLRPGSVAPCDLRSASFALEACKARYPNQPLGLLIGDSQSAAATRSLINIAAANGVGLVTLASGGCISLMSAEIRIPASAMAANCKAYRQNGEKLLPGASPSFAILYSYWTLYADPRTHYYFVDETGAKAQDQRDAFLKGFRNTVDYLHSLGVSRILVIGPTPTFPRSSPECVIRSLVYRQSPDLRCSQPREAENSRRALAMTWLREAQSERDDFILIDPIEVFCDSEMCRPYKDRTVYFNDTNHISDAGIAAINSKFEEEFGLAMTGK